MRHRVAIRRQVVGGLKGAQGLGEVLVETGWSGDLAEAERVSLGATTGAMTIPVFCGQPSEDLPVTYDDAFTIKLYIEAGAKGQTYDEADDRMAEMWAAVERTLRQMTFRDDDDGHWFFTDAAVTNVQTAIGPQKNHGFIGVLEADLAFEIRISGRAK